MTVRDNRGAFGACRTVSKDGYLIGRLDASIVSFGSPISGELIAPRFRIQDTPFSPVSASKIITRYRDPR